MSQQLAHTGDVPGPARGPRPSHLREAHAHLFAFGQGLAIPSLASCGSLVEALDAVRREASALPPAEVVRLGAANNNRWPEGRWPTVAELDAASGGRPCVIRSFDHHTAVCNGAALARSGLTPGEKLDANSYAEVDETGVFTGLLHEAASKRVWYGAGDGEPSPAEQQQSLRLALAHLAGLGFAEVHDMLAPAWLGAALIELERAGGLPQFGDQPMRIRIYSEPANLDSYLAQRSHWPAWLRFGGVKLFADGTLSSRTALMMHRYSEPLIDAPRGRCIVAPALITETVRRCRAAGVGLAVHAIGDGAVRMVLDCVQRAGAADGGTPNPDQLGRVRIEHAELIDKMDVPRFVSLGVDCSVQPCHLLSDMEALDRFVPHRLDRVLPLRELLDAGLRPGFLGERTADPAGLVFGSDVPIVRAEPEDSILAATLRRRPEMPPQSAIAPAQAITEAEAWSCFAARERV